jgi:starch phosphorylase
VAYFCMEFAIHQPLKTYAGGLGFLAGSHMRSAYELKQNVVGIGILWKYGYYDQIRKQDQTMDVLFQEKIYGFLKETGIKFTIKVSGHDVFVTAWYLPPEVFETAPVFFLSTDLPENDYLAKTICHKLYDANPETPMAAQDYWKN